MKLYPYIRYASLCILTCLLAASCKQETYFNITTRIEPEGSGSITVSSSSGSAHVLDGTSVSFKATPASDYIFTGWNGSFSGKENPKVVTVSANLNVVANFELKTYPLTISVQGEGTVSERVISTKADYGSGTVVELTANPSAGWSFDHWEGDLSVTNSPVQITVSDAKSVKAVFVQNHYRVQVNAVGPGVVNEYITETRTCYPVGTIVRFVASPSHYAYDVEFLGWEGDLSGRDLSISFPMEKETDVTAKFGKVVRKFPKPNLKAPWICQKRLYSGMDFTGLSNDAADIITLDYNDDGYVDVVTTVTENNEYISDDCPVRFFLGGPDGLFTPDPVNDGKLFAEDPRKIMSCDFNNDGIPDFMTVGHGYDAAPWPGEYTVALMSNPDGSYYDIRFTNLIGYYHGSTLGDFDNDGDVDVFLMDSRNMSSAFLVNDGKGNFTVNSSIVCNTEGKYTCELYDFDKDGFLDLISGDQIVWGNGVTFAENQITEYFTENPFADLALDFDVYDLNGDGTEELILGMTDGEGYTCRCVRILERNGRSFKDVTKDYFFGTDYIERNTKPAIWIDMEEVDGNVYLVGRMRDNGVRLYQLINGRFSKISHSINPLDGMTFYCDGFEQVGSHWNPGCTEQPYKGKTCIRFSDWTSREIFHLFENEDWIDFSPAEAEGYALEFAIKTDDPDLVVSFNFETLLQTDPWYFPTYFYEYRANEHNCQGQWELVRIPLSNFQLGEDWKDGYYWNKIKNFYISPANYAGKEFYLDEIRLRKVLQ